MTKQNNYFLFLMLVLSLVLASMVAKAADPLDVMCRNKAKDIAVQAYQNCLNDGKGTQLKENYKKELNALNAKYDKLAKAEGAAPAVPAVPTVAEPKKRRKPVKVANLRRAEKPVDGVATKLPAKQNNNGPARPMNEDSDEVPVVAVDSISAMQQMPVSSANETNDPTPEDTGY